MHVQPSVRPAADRPSSPLPAGAPLPSPGVLRRKRSLLHPRGADGTLWNRSNRFSPTRWQENNGQNQTNPQRPRAPGDPGCPSHSPHEEGSSPPGVSPVCRSQCPDCPRTNPSAPHGTCQGGGSVPTYRRGKWGPDARQLHARSHRSPGIVTWMDPDLMLAPCSQSLTCSALVCACEHAWSICTHVCVCRNT